MACAGIVFPPIDGAIAAAETAVSAADKYKIEPFEYAGEYIGVAA